MILVLSCMMDVAFLDLSGMIVMCSIDDRGYLGLKWKATREVGEYY